MQGLVLFIHIVVSFVLIIVVLLQSGKSADLAGAFGGAGSQSTFGPRGAASFLSRATSTLAVLFMITSLSLYILAAKQGKTSGTVFDREDTKQEQKVDQPVTDTEQPKKDNSTENKNQTENPSTTKSEDSKE